jgi:pyrroline-5-carboxylate reductase
MATWIVQSLLHRTSGISRAPKILASVRTERSGARLHQELQSHGERFEVRLEDDIGVAFASDVVMLACKPYDAQKVVAAPGIADALHGKASSAYYLALHLSRFAKQSQGTN